MEKEQVLAPVAQFHSRGIPRRGFAGGRLCRL